MLISLNKISLFIQITFVSLQCNQLITTTMRTSRKSSTMGANLKMSNEVFTLRREVMNHIYEAKNLLRNKGIALPRIEIRITDNKGTCGHALGQARLHSNCIWIAERTLENYKGHLREIVFHEIVHAVVGFEHDDNCRLMSPCIEHTPLSVEETDKNFIKYFIK